MENYHGIFSLLIACIEFVFLLNTLIFAEKNLPNKLIIIILVLLPVDQFLEFYICYFEYNSPVLLYIKALNLTIVIPLFFYFSLRLLKNYTKKYLLLFLPAFIVFFYSSANTEVLFVNNCTLFSASFSIPEYYWITFYFYLLSSLIALYLASIKNQNHRKIFIVIFAGLIVAVLPSIIASLLVSSLNEIKVSMLSKGNITLSVTLIYFALKYKQAA